MEELKIVAEQELLGKQLHIYGSVTNPLFLAKEVAEWISYNVSSTNKMIGRVDDTEKVRKNIPTPGGAQEMWCLTEEGVYEVLMGSKKPIAKEFKREVKAILKTIRLTGGFVANSDAFVDAYFGGIDISMKPVLSAMLEASRQQTLVINQQVVQLTQKDELINVLQPKATYADIVLSGKTLVNITQIAKDYGMSGKELNALLHMYNVQYKSGDQWLLYAQHASEGYVGSSTVLIEHHSGQTGAKMNTKWTQKGRLFIYNLLKTKGIVPVIERTVVAPHE